MGTSIGVTKETFATEVLERSHQMPVLVDFYATWCGPCQILKPMLEKLVQEYEVVLAKVDIDAEPELAQTYEVQGVPDVRIVIEGEVSEWFVGVLPEHQLRQLMAQLSLNSQLDQVLASIYDEAAIGQVESAQARLNDLLQQYPDNRGLLLEAANFLIETDQISTAEALLNQIQEHEKQYIEKAKLLKALIFFKQIAAETEAPTDLDRILQTAAKQLLAEDYEPALNHLLDLISRDRKFRNDGARKAMLEAFNLLGGDHPLTMHYRKRLMTVLY